MQQIITNIACDVELSSQAVHDLTKIKEVLPRLIVVHAELVHARKIGAWNTPRIKANVADLSAILHKHINGWS